MVTMPIYFACLKSIKNSQMCISKAHKLRQCILDVSGDQFLCMCLYQTNLVTTLDDNR